ncbi:MAG: ribonuclease HI [Lentisphaeria bacterium]|jgi:ribonuclease HI
MATKYYVVWQGRTPGIYADWAGCSKQVDKFAGAKYKSFTSKVEAEVAFKGEGKSSAVAAGSGVKRRKSNGAGVKTYTVNEVLALLEDTKIFTDGGCEPNPGKAGSGLALYRNNALKELWYGLYNPSGTNNTAELNALHQALIQAKAELTDGKSVAIFCDSKYAIQCVTEWAVTWEKRGWKKASGEIKNLELIKEIYALFQLVKSNVKVLHVNGHVGVEGNELADRMSICAMSEKQSTFIKYGEPMDIAKILSLKSG